MVVSFKSAGFSVYYMRGHPLKSLWSYGLLVEKGLEVSLIAN